MSFTRVTMNPAVMGGAPTLRGLRNPVATVLAMIADGMTAEEVVGDLPDLEVKAVREVLAVLLDKVRGLQSRVDVDDESAAELGSFHADRSRTARHAHHPPTAVRGHRSALPAVGAGR